MKYPDVTLIKKSPIIPEKVNFIFKIIELFNYYQKNKIKNTQKSLSKEEDFLNFHNFLFQKYQHIKNLNRLRVGNLIGRLILGQILKI